MSTSCRDDEMTSRNGNWHATHAKPLQVTVQIIQRSQLNGVRYGEAHRGHCTRSNELVSE